MPVPALENRVPVVAPGNRFLTEFRRWNRRMINRCRRLKIGDEVRFLQMPSSAGWPDILLPQETRRNTTCRSCALTARYEHAVDLQ